MGEKGNQNSTTPLGDGTTEWQSLGKAVLGHALVEERQSGTTELCQNAVAQTPSLLLDQNVKPWGRKPLGKLRSGRSFPL